MRSNELSNFQGDSGSIVNFKRNFAIRGSTHATTSTASNTWTLDP